ncbi:hydroxymethylglutaryl-CoA lyase [bacterium]|nr:hydroxymethylglutaryl-CoA lyase [bacterium]
MSNDPVTIVEVGARDGLQYEAAILPVEQRLELLKRLSSTGLKRIEGGSFVNPKILPQMAGSDELARLVQGMDWPQGIRFSWLVPNERGLDIALDAGVREIALFIATSDAFSKANINCTVEESFQRIAPVAERALKAGMKVRGYVSTIFGFMDEVIAPERTMQVTQRLLDLGCYEVSLGDTTGIGTPQTTAALLEQARRQNIPFNRLALHLHDTGGRAIENIAVGYDMGIRTFDSAVGGLGGCPFAGSPKGNVATSLVLDFFDQKNIPHGIDPAAITDTADWVKKLVGKA